MQRGVPLFKKRGNPFLFVKRDQEGFSAFRDKKRVAELEIFLVNLK